MYRESNLGLLIKLAPKEAALKINQAFLEFNLHDQSTEGRALELVAARLDCSPSSLKRHLRLLEQLDIPVRRIAKAEPSPKPAVAKIVGKKPLRKKKSKARTI